MLYGPLFYSAEQRKCGKPRFRFSRFGYNSLNFIFGHAVGCVIWGGYKAYKFLMRKLEAKVPPRQP